MNRWDVINYLIEQNDYKSYLELGYYKGWSFDQVQCESKIAVDPSPCKDNDQLQLEYRSSILIDEGSLICKETSDDFFAGKPLDHDIYFIDGSHNSEVVYRDIINCLTYLKEGGTIVLHDCNPPTEEHTTTGVDGCWTGDVYKAIIKAQQHLAIDFYTVDTDWGVGIMRPKPLGMHSSPYLGNVTWNMFDKNRQFYLNLITPEEFLKREKHN